MLFIRMKFGKTFMYTILGKLGREEEATEKIKVIGKVSKSQKFLKVRYLNSLKYFKYVLL